MVAPGANPGPVKFGVGIFKITTPDPPIPPGKKLVETQFGGGNDPELAPPPPPSPGVPPPKGDPFKAGTKGVRALKLPVPPPPSPPVR